MPEIRVGTSGFSFADWKGPIYPVNMVNKDMFTFYVGQLRFNTLEINYTFYQQPAQRTINSLIMKSPSNFKFVVKAHSSLTHDFRDEKTHTIVDNSDSFNIFLSGIQPMSDSGKLGAVLAQFGPTFVPYGDNLSYLLKMKERFGNTELIAEFRNRRWNDPICYEFLKNNEIGYCIVDEPKIGPLMPYNPKVTSKITYFRLHGRNKLWFKDPDQRYNYLYSESELKEFIPAIKNLTQSSTICYIMFNNCHGGFAAKNAKMMQRLLGLDIEEAIQGNLF